MKKILIFIFMFFPLTIFADNNYGLNSAIEKSASGMRAQAKRIAIASQNIANAEVTGLSPGSEPYRRQIISFKYSKDKKNDNFLTKIHKIGKDYSNFKFVYEPNHPAANDNGYVLYPNVDRMIETRDIEEARRSYEANLGALNVSKSMLMKTIDLLK